jgi:hypothetical protein
MRWLALLLARERERERDAKTTAATHSNAGIQITCMRMLYTSHSSTLEQHWKTMSKRVLSKSKSKKLQHNRKIIHKPYHRVTMTTSTLALEEDVQNSHVFAN